MANDNPAIKHDRIGDLAWTRGLGMHVFYDNFGGEVNVSVVQGHGKPDSEVQAFLSEARAILDEPEPVKAPPVPTGGNIADKAAKLVLGDRNDSYGDPGDDYAGTARVWSGLLIHKLKPGVEIDTREAILMMAAMKLRREITKPKEDSRIDAIGYVLCADWVTTGNKPTPSSDNQPNNNP
jgi:hypothetical protein